MTDRKCYGCGEPATKTFDGFPACEPCYTVCKKFWEDEVIKPLPLTPVEGAAILGDIITRKP